MRCKNCGWPNLEGAKKCVKCQTPLDQNKADNNDGTIHADNLSPLPLPPNGGQEMKRTLLEPGKEDAGPTRGNGTNTRNTMVTKCPKCGYPLRNGITKCPKCQHVIGSLEGKPTGNIPNVEMPSKRQPLILDGSKLESFLSPSSDQEEQPQTPPQKSKGNIPPAPRHGGTINVWDDLSNFQNSAVNGFMLTPVARHGEKRTMNPREFTGDSVQLNRSNTEPDNMSITSKVQAVITCEDGKWFVQDQSDLHTTFVLASRKTRLKDGDILLLGNRLFEFHEQ